MVSEKISILKYLKNLLNLDLKFIYFTIYLYITLLLKLGIALQWPRLSCPLIVLFFTFLTHSNIQTSQNISYSFINVLDVKYICMSYPAQCKFIFSFSIYILLQYPTRFYIQLALSHYVTVCPWKKPDFSDFNQDFHHR